MSPRVLAACQVCFENPKWAHALVDAVTFLVVGLYLAPVVSSAKAWVRLDDASRVVGHRALRQTEGTGDLRLRHAARQHFQHAVPGDGHEHMFGRSWDGIRERSDYP